MYRVAQVLLYIYYYYGIITNESHLERKLVHWMDLAEVIHDEVEHRSLGSCRSIVFTSIIDFHFSHLGLLYLLDKETMIHNLKLGWLSENRLSMVQCVYVCLCIGMEREDWGGNLSFLNRSWLWIEIIHF